ncbi:hypothetical protein DMK78_23590 [Salmonella enterica]|uniref:hypothetical protein n=1 Tax=Enterobacteriaceae TaxID=543 RepID=UPI0009730146|nr:MULTISPECIES: hypothetical protein [Enterobacteriaceae]EAB6670217.1 hypothetical protein [Salmonella enterica subsp. enterica serovar Enteritidis]EAS4050837.1 hypothetical protein [Salmonella enterica]EDQ9490359.1 hypothetical protein [Salmonella enterica subsp. enterica]EDT4607131.1 hypothetical protein [Salmonella enterica subsp. enterica serovar Durban]HCM4208639.1 hypothetical protein [Salmonella enterica subsp. enterica serovar Saintpaul]HDT0072559.1 hypothetical protein [Klebsiella p
MISVDGYKHALKMLEILDMNLDDFLFEKYLNIALDYENQSGFFCSNYRLDHAVVSLHQTAVPYRAARPILAIVTFGESPFFTLDYDDKGRIKGRCAVRSKT